MKRAAIVIVAAMTIAALSLTLFPLNVSAGDTVSNLFDSATCSPDSSFPYHTNDYETGEIVPYDGYLVTNYIPITPYDWSGDVSSMGCLYIRGLTFPASTPSEKNGHSCYVFYYTKDYKPSGYLTWTQLGTENDGVWSYDGDYICFRLGFALHMAEQYLTTLNVSYMARAQYVRILFEMPDDPAALDDVYIGYDKEPEPEPVYWEYGAIKKSSYNRFDNPYDENVYIVDKKDWFMGDKPFMESPSEVYRAYWSYIPCVASYPVSYTTTIAQNATNIVAANSTVYRKYYYLLDTTSFVDDHGVTRSKMVLSCLYSDDGEISTELWHSTLSEGVQFFETCIYIGCFVTNHSNTSTSAQINFAFLLDGVIRWHCASIPSYDDLYMGSGYSYPFYVFGFSTTQASNYNDYLYNDDFGSVFFSIYDQYKSSEKFTSWVYDFYTSVPEQTRDAVSEILDVIKQPATVPAPPSAGPSQEFLDNQYEIEDTDESVGAVFDQYFDDAIDSLKDMPSVGDTTDFVVLSEIFSWTILQIFDLPNFGIIIDAFVFVFLMSVLGLNLSTIFKKSDNSDSDNSDRGDKNAGNDR